MSDRVIIQTECKARGEKYAFTCETVTEALDLYFKHDAEEYFVDGVPQWFTDADGEDELTRDEAEALLHEDRELTFYNDEGEAFRLTLEAK